MKRVSGYNKIIDKSQLCKIVAKLKKQGKIIVTTNGSFDILHAGHIYLLKKAKRYGDRLIVGLNSDLSIKKYKSKDRPIITQNFRAELLAAIQYVDYVYIFNETNPVNFLKMIKPNIHINSAEYGRNCIEAPTIKKYGGRLILLSKKKNLLSTTQIIKKITKVTNKT